MWYYTRWNKWKRVFRNGPEWCQHQGRIRLPSFCPPSNNSNLASSHGQKCLCGSCGIQYHPRRELRSLTHHVLGNRHTDFSPAMDPAAAHELAPVLLDSGLGILDNTVLDNHPQMRELLWKSRFPEKFHHIIAKKK